ncbi:MAG: nucleotidyltransferase domain-containing protein [Thermoflexia bacterium]|nr:MAG: nucleotidyltransferase domain-containing protein [Thermoflexia bacterium]
MTAWSPEEIAIAQENLRRRREAEYRAREAQRQKALQALRDAAPRVFPRFPAVRRAYLFGSVTDPGQIGPAPDVDVAVEGALSPEDYFALWRALEEESGETVGLVELTGDSPFASRVRESGEVIYERQNPDAEGSH